VNGVEIGEDGMAIAPPPKPLNPAQLKEIRDAFAFFDTDKSGFIDRHEMHEAMKALGFKCTLEDAENLIAEYDEDDSQTIEFEEFKELMKSKIGERLTKFGDQVKIGHRAALQYDMGMMRMAMKKQQAEHLKQKHVIEAKATRVSQTKETLLAEDQAWDLNLLREEKRQQLMRRTHPSRATCELEVLSERALRAGAFAQRDVVKKELAVRVEEDTKRQRKETEQRLKLMEQRMSESQLAAQIRCAEKNRRRQIEVTKVWEHKNRELAHRAVATEGSMKRRHNRACRMLCDEVHDMGVTRMRTFGTRYREAMSGPLWEMPSLTGVHEFSKADEAASLARVRAERKCLAVPQARATTAMSLHSEVPEPVWGNVNMQRSATSMG